MNLTVSGHHVAVTPAIRSYLAGKLTRVERHFDSVIDISVVMSVERAEHRVEANVHLRGRDLFAESVDADMYAAIDSLVDKLDRQIVKHKEKRKAARVVPPPDINAAA